MKIVLSVVWFASVCSLGDVLGQSGDNYGSACLQFCYDQQGGAYCCSGAGPTGSYRPTLTSSSNTFQQPFTSSLGSTQPTYQPLATGPFQQNTLSTAGAIQGPYQPHAAGAFSQNTGLTGNSYRQPSTITKDAYQQQGLSPVLYQEPTVINSGSGVQATSLLGSTSATIGSRRQPSTNANNGTLQHNHSVENQSQTSLLSTSILNAGQQNTIQDTEQCCRCQETDSFGHTNVQATDSFGRPLTTNHGPYQQSHVLPDPGTTNIGGGTFQGQHNFRQPLNTQRNYNQQLASPGTVSYQRPVSNARGSYGTEAYQQPLGLSVGSYQRTDNRYVN